MKKIIILILSALVLFSCETKTETKTENKPDSNYSKKGKITLVKYPYLPVVSIGYKDTISNQSYVQMRAMEDCPEKGTPFIYTDLCGKWMSIMAYDPMLPYELCPRLFDFQNLDTLKFRSRARIHIYDSLAFFKTLTANTSWFLAGNSNGEIGKISQASIVNSAAVIAALGFTPVNYTAGNGITISSGVISRSKRQETYSGTTNGSGNYSVTFGTAYAVAPNIQANYIGGTALYRQLITVTNTGFTVQVVSQNTNTLLGIINLVSSTTPVTGASVDVLITEK